MKPPAPFLIACLAGGLAGCGGQSATGADAIVPGDGSAAVDAPHESGIDAGSACVGTLRSLCAPVTTGDLLLSGGTIDTSSSGGDARCVDFVEGSAGPAWCVLFGADVHVTGTVSATGDRLLVLAALGTLTVTGTLDVSSHAGSTGPTADASPCRTPNTPGTDATSGAGGAGGSFHTLGGSGGANDGTTTPTAPAVQPMFDSSILRGGCPGDPGGHATGATAAAGGHSGGAVFLVAGTKIEIDGSILAGGAGGGVAAASGGGGGGTGGFVGLDGPMIHLAATSAIVASGGGGGGGANAAGAAGTPGSDAGSVAAQTAAATGGAGAPATGGAGGAGSFTQTQGTAGSASVDASGGGGGGAAGFIFTYAGVVPTIDSGAVLVPGLGL